nr:MAG TPA: hypothetical protein [Caudoviricetes sp.]
MPSIISFRQINSLQGKLVPELQYKSVTECSSIFI